MKEFIKIYQNNKEKIMHRLLDDIDSGNIGAYMMTTGSESFISHHYVSKKFNTYVVTLVKKFKDGRMMAFDFDLYRLLMQTQHTAESSGLFVTGTKYVYAIIGMGLSLFALMLVFYSLYAFTSHLSLEHSDIFEVVFKSTIGLTLGLAIFDLAKNLLEHEVVFTEETNEAHGSSRLLIKFLISIAMSQFNKELKSVS